MSDARVVLTPVEDILTDPEGLNEFKQKHQDLRRILRSRLAQSPLPFAPRETELQWLSSHPEILTANAGKWIALKGESLVAASSRLSDVITVAKNMGIIRPLFLYIPFDPKEYLLGLSNQPAD